MASRRKFLSAGLVGLTAKAERHIAGRFVNDSHSMGHTLRDRTARSTPKRTQTVPVVIVGGGIAGLSAAWRLDKRGFRDFAVLEMENQAGGNSRWGENEITRYPWAAHYIPAPNREAVFVREILEEFGAIRDGHFEERFLCFTPQERLFIHGRWQDGIGPHFALPVGEREQVQRFEDMMRGFRDTKEFTVPMEAGAKTSELDRISMADWMKQNGFLSSGLRWYVDYCCRDDYGANAGSTSAWAGIHYHASREHEARGPLTWPEGNGWIVMKLMAKLGKYVRTGQMVREIRPEGRNVRVLAGDTEYVAQRVIFAAPTFLARYLMEAPPAAPMEYSPWLTANLTLDRIPASAGEVAWDNVIYGSPALGYVSATHMGLETHREKTVWTYYLALGEADARQQRRSLLTHEWQFWKERILLDLQRAHADIRECVARIDVMRMGHAMARPTAGSLFAAWRAELKRTDRPVVFANSDVTGFSIFEEAQYRGVRAADGVMKALGRG